MLSSPRAGSSIKSRERTRLSSASRSANSGRITEATQVGSGRPRSTGRVARARRRSGGRPTLCGQVQQGFGAGVTKPDRSHLMKCEPRRCEVAACRPHCKAQAGTNRPLDLRIAEFGLLVASCLRPDPFPSRTCGVPRTLSRRLISTLATSHAAAARTPASMIAHWASPLTYLMLAHVLSWLALLARSDRQGRRDPGAPSRGRPTSTTQSTPRADVC
jgi:hypothetical protein